MYLRDGPALYQHTTGGLAIHTTPYELLFRSLFDPGRGCGFPCNANGRMAPDDLSDRLRDNYRYARAVVGRELAAPAVQASGLPEPAH